MGNNVTAQRKVRCTNCGILNRVPSYSFRKIPRCGRCKTKIPELIATQLVRFVHANPLLWSALGASLFVAGFVFLDRYSPKQGLIWNAVNGTIGNVPTRYVVVTGVLLFFLGVASAAKR